MPKIVDHDQYRKELLNACIPIFASNSYGSISMRQIAQQLGVTTGTLYHYFTSKEDIFNQLVEHMAVDSLIQSTMTVEQADTLEQRLDSYIQFIKGFEKQIMQTILILTDYIRTEEAKEEGTVPRHSIEAFGHVEWTAEYLQVDDLTLVRHLLYMIQGIVVQRYMEKDKSSIDQHLELAKNTFLSLLESRKAIDPNN